MTASISSPDTVCPLTISSSIAQSATISGGIGIVGCRNLTNGGCASKRVPSIPYLNGTKAALLKAEVSEYSTRYVCTRHRSGKRGACDASRQHRLGWVERAVLEKLLSDILHPAKLPRFLKVFVNR